MSRNIAELAGATPGDAEEIARLEAVCFSHPRSEAALLSEISQPERYVLVVMKSQKGLVKGYAGMEYVLDEGYITDVAVFPDRRRCGVGTALLQELERRARRLKLRFLTLEVRPGNLAAVRLYISLGYEESGRRRGFYTDPREDALLMTKYL